MTRRRTSLRLFSLVIGLVLLTGGLRQFLEESADDTVALELGGLAP